MSDYAEFIDAKWAETVTEYPAVEILWIDAAAHAVHNWSDEWESGVKHSVTIGYLMGESEDMVTVYSTVNESHYCHGMTIPRGCIVEIRYLNV